MQETLCPIYMTIHHKNSPNISCILMETERTKQPDIGVTCMQANEAGARIKARRKALKLSQKDLGERLGVDQSTVAHWESGRNALTLELTCKVAAALKMSPAVLAFGPQAPGACRIRWRVDAYGEVLPVSDGIEVPMPPGDEAYEAIAVSEAGRETHVLFVSVQGDTPISVINNGWQALIETDDGKAYIGSLYFGEKRGLFSIHRGNGAPVLNALIRRVRMIQWSFVLRNNF